MGNKGSLRSLTVRDLSKSSKMTFWEAHFVNFCRITGSDRDVSLELDVGYRSVSVSPEGLYGGREFILDRGRGPGRGEGGRRWPRVLPKKRP